MHDLKNSIKIFLTFTQSKGLGLGPNLRLGASSLGCPSTLELPGNLTNKFTYINLLLPILVNITKFGVLFLEAFQMYGQPMTSPKQPKLDLFLSSHYHIW